MHLQTNTNTKVQELLSLGSYSANWKKTQFGNGIDENSVLEIKVANANYISGGIYKNGYPVLALFGQGETAKILLSRKGMSLKGLCVLKIRGHFNDMRGFGYDDAFICL